MRLIVLLALACVSGAVSASDLMDSRKNCKLAWPGNGLMQHACHDNNMAARKALKKLRREHGKTIRACERANPGALRGVDYSAALQCTRIELKRQRRK